MPLFWLGISFVFGIFSGNFLSLPKEIYIFLLAVSIIISLAEHFLVPIENHPLRRSKLFQVTFSVLIVIFLFGNLRFKSALPKPLSSENASSGTINNAIAKGLVISDPVDTNRWTTANLRLTQIIIKDKSFPLRDKLAVYLPAAYHIEYGDELLLVGDLEPTLDADTSIADSFYASRGIFWKMNFPVVEFLAYDQGNKVMDSLYGLRNHAYQNITEWMPFPESALIAGILLGIDQNIPDFLEDAYRATGTIHIIAISGFNIAMIAGLVTRLFRKILPKYWDGALAAAAVLFYTILVGADPAVTRAALMGVVAIPAYYIGRRIIGINLLTIAAAVMLAFNPLLLWNTSFQLSYLATIGLMVLADPLSNLMYDIISKNRTEETAEFAHPMIILLASTIAAQFAVLPVLYQFDPSLKLFSLLANSFILPLQPPLMIIGGIALLFGFFIPSIGALLLKIAWPFATLSNRTAVRMSLYPGAEYHLPDWGWIPVTVLVGVVITWMSIRDIRGFNQPDVNHQED